MSDNIKHECGIALIRLLKPIEYYIGKYGTFTYGINKLYLLMEKQHNRGQDGAGVASIKLNMKPGIPYINRLRSNSDSPIKDIFSNIYSSIKQKYSEKTSLLNDTEWLKENIPFSGELLLGHLRYGTYGNNDIERCHPLIRSNNWMTKNLVIAGNFNLTNISELFNRLLSIGQHPVETSDTVTILEKIGHFLDEENEKIYRYYKQQNISKREATPLIARDIDITKILYNSCKYWDGGYVIAGMIGHGDAFVIRDPNGIRPAYYYYDDEIVVVTSERPPIQTAFNVKLNNIVELKPGHVIIVKKDGSVKEELCIQPYQDKKSCMFERIYFSRGTDYTIYNERKNLGRYLCNDILKAINYDIENTVFSYVPNTAIDAFYGLNEALNDYVNNVKKNKLLSLKQITEEALNEIMFIKPRIEKIAVKDVKLRTFITQDADREDLVSHVYDITYGVIRENIDTIVIIDDSIVRGTTLKKSILTMLGRLNPKKIIVVSSAPQIRYPDVYGIDMAKLSDFVAFRAAIELLKEKKMTSLINEVYQKSIEQQNKPKEQIVNYVKEIYKPFSVEQISEKIAEIVKPDNFKPSVQIIFQSIENLHKAIPSSSGDWYFTGDYPTPGGNMAVNRAFINYIENRNIRAY